MYFAIIANDAYPDETYTSDIYYRRPNLNQLYEKFGVPEENKGRYYKWCVQVKKITNFQSIDHVAGLEFSEDGYPDEGYVVGGDGYLHDEHKQRLTQQQQEKELCGS
jgi:hypothetical protein